jgi:hypothetical protein
MTKGVIVWAREIPATIAGETGSSGKKAINRKCRRVSHYRFLFIVAKWWFVTWPLLQVGRWPNINVS